MSLYLIPVEKDLRLCVAEGEFKRLARIFPQYKKYLQKAEQVIKHSPQSIPQCDRNNITNVWKGIIGERKLGGKIDTILEMMGDFLQYACRTYQLWFTEKQVGNMVSCAVRLIVEYQKNYGLDKYSERKYASAFLHLIGSVYSLDESCPTFPYIGFISEIVSKGLPILLEVCPTDVVAVEEGKRSPVYRTPKIKIDMAGRPGLRHVLSVLENVGFSPPEKMEKLADLVRKGAKLNVNMPEYEIAPGIYNKQARIPLLEAMYLKNEDLVLFMLSAGADPRVTGKDYGMWYPIHFAVRFNMPRVVKFILDKYPDQVRAKNPKYTPYGLAEVDKKEDMMNLIRRYM